MLSLFLLKKKRAKKHYQTASITLSLGLICCFIGLCTIHPFVQVKIFFYVPTGFATLIVCEIHNQSQGMDAHL